MKQTIAAFALLIAAQSHAQTDLRPINTKIERVQYRGVDAVRLVPLEKEPRTAGQMLALLPSTMKDGTIELRLSGAPRPDAPPDSRGFIGVAFHVQADAAKYECFYLRPENARADDQLRRNHTAQYISHPDFPWHMLRKNHPGVYESYTDMDPRGWTKVKIVVRGTSARLYINDAAQPALIVNDLKLGGAGGGVALWSHTTTDAYFADFSVTR